LDTISQLSIITVPTLAIAACLEGLTMENNQRERVRLVIAHEFAQVAGQCAPGEGTLGAFLVWRGRVYWIPLGPTHLILFDFLCRHRWIAMDASTIASRLRIDLFVVHHGSNAPGNRVRRARSSRTAVRKQIERIREAIAKLIVAHGLELDAFEILRSEETSTLSKRYRINADVSFDHWGTTKAFFSNRTVAGIPLHVPHDERRSPARDQCPPDSSASEDAEELIDAWSLSGAS
jgi:hypothetical protein